MYYAITQYDEETGEDIVIGKAQIRTLQNNNSNKIRIHDLATFHSIDIHKHKYEEKRFVNKTTKILEE